MINPITEEPVVVLTAAAAGEVKSLLALPENAGKLLRLYVEEGGCSGMRYEMVFDQDRDGDISAEQHGVKVVVDPFSAKFLRGSIVEFSDELTGGGFKLKNPNSRQTCGCGKSFEA